MRVKLFIKYENIKIFSKEMIFFCVSSLYLQRACGHTPNKEDVSHIITWLLSSNENIQQYTADGAKVKVIY